MIGLTNPVVLLNNAPEAGGGACVGSQVPLQEKTVVRNPSGLHMRPATILVQLAKHFACDVCLKVEDRRADLKSLMNVLLLAVEPGKEVIVEIHGERAGEALPVFISFLSTEDMDTWNHPCVSLGEG
jgi:phosphotransferase system HPr (HPr) family protein